MRSIVVLLFLAYAVAAQAQPVIATHPQGQSDISGATITLSVSATGSPLQYQWRQDAVPLTGATNSTIVISNFGNLSVGSYDVVASNISGSVTSDVAGLTLEGGYMFTTIAGLATNFGSFDGVGSSARFASIRGVAVDAAKNIYVADAAMHTIRKISSAGVVSTLAGLAGKTGSSDGTNSNARFNRPSGVAVDSVGNVYVADFVNQTIRRVTSEGVVTTLAGKAGTSGGLDGTGTNATFVLPNGLALDLVGNLYVAESGGTAPKPFRKVMTNGVVSTLTNTFSSTQFAGLVVDGGSNIFAVQETSPSRVWRIAATGTASVFAGAVSGYSDGLRTNAQFSGAWGITLDGENNLILADRLSNTIRKITTNGVVSTLGGLGGSSGSADGEGSVARFNSPWSVAVDSAGALYVADGNGTIRKGIRYTGAPFISTQPLCQAVAPGSSVTFSITVTSAAPASCQWQFQGTDIPGETNTSLTLTNVQLGNVGNYRAFVTNALGSDASVFASLGILGQPVSFLNGPENIQYAADGLHLQLSGLVGQGQIIVYASTNLTAWDAIYTNYAGFGSLGFTDPGATNFPQRFYRASVSGAP